MADEEIGEHLKLRVWIGCDCGAFNVEIARIIKREFD